MSEEIAQAAGDLAYWQRRAEQSEAALADDRQRAHDIANATAPLQLDLVMAREDLAKAQADAAAIIAAARYYTQAESLETRLRGWGTLCDIAAREKPGAALLAELEAARDEIAFLREWLRGELTISDAEIDAAVKASKS